MNPNLISKQPCTYIIILNWNGWRDTLQCLESVLCLTDSRYRIIVCDNGSTDGSMKAMQEWAEGRLRCKPTETGHLATLRRSTASVVPYVRTTRTELQEGYLPRSAPLTFIENEENLGFAGGNNPGLQLALSRPDMTHVWLLNNDTLVEPDCLEQLHRRMQQDKNVGCCGSLIKFFDNPAIIQAVGGCTFNHQTGIASETLGRYLPDNTPLDFQEFEQRMDYVSGACMLVSRRFLESAGLMEESYFLYYEEIDWATRAGPEFKLAIAGDAVTYHKEGSSIGSASYSTAPSVSSEFYLMRSKLKFMRRHHPRWLLVCYVVCVIQMGRRLIRRQWSNAVMMLKLLSRPRAWT